MQARLRRSISAPSGLEYHVLTPKGMVKYLERQSRAPDHLKDFFCLEQSHRSITEYCPGLGVGPNVPNQTPGIFVADSADPEDQKRCTAFNGVQNIDELINSDRPVMTIQVTRFSDATLITLSASHIIGDSFTIKAIFKSWESTLHGNIPVPFEQLGRDPFSAYGPGGHLAGDQVESDSPPLPPGWQIYGLFDKARFMSRFLWDCRISRPESSISQKYIFIPDTEAQNLEEQAKRDLIVVEERRKQQGIEAHGPLTVSRSNILYAWILQHNHAPLDPEQRSSPVTIVNARIKPPTGMKARSDDFPSNDWYGAAMVVALPSLKVGQLQAMPLGELALHIREGTKEGSSPENARRWLAFNLHHNLWKKPSGKFAFWSPPNHKWSGLSDWRLVQLQDLDFTPARLDQDNPPVTICGFNSHMVFGSTQRDRWVCLGEAGGGTWLLGFMSDPEWQDPRGFGKYTHLRRA